MVSAIIPAYNEEATIGEVIRSLSSNPSISEIIVVDDGSTDRTGKIARMHGATVITLSGNGGKAGAMDVGVSQAKSDVILFLDADVLGYTHENISRIILPVLKRKKEMYVAVRGRKTILLNRLLHLFPILSGERALTRELWNSVPKKHKNGFEIEIALNYAAKQTRLGMGFEYVFGLRHVIKEKKYGYAIGLIRRMKMCYEVMSISVAIYLLEPLRSFLGRFSRSGKKA